MTFATIANAASAFSSSFFYESTTDSGASAIWVQGAGYLVTIYFAQLSSQYKLTGNFINKQLTNNFQSILKTKSAVNKSMAYLCINLKFYDLSSKF